MATSSAAGPTTELPRVRSRIPRVAGHLGGAPWGLIVPLSMSLLVTLIWIAIDERAVDWDTSRHLMNTFVMREALARGELSAPLVHDNINTYPPLLYMIGAVGTVIGGAYSFDAAVIAQDLVFVPLLVAGCWGTARYAYGDLAGFVAAVVAVGSPIVIDLFHLYMLDGPQAAGVAATVWLVLISRRFASVPLAALAGLVAAGGMLLKPTTAIFLAGFLLVVILRGGWRNWVGVLVFGVVCAVLAGPWYLEHLDELRGLTRGATGPVNGGGEAVQYSYVTPPRWSDNNWLWYAWTMMNGHLFFPLFAAFVVGTATALVRFVRTRRPEDPTPELIVGGFVSYVGLTWIALKDPRYTIPAIVFVAALAAAWVPALARRRRARLVAVVAVVVVAAINLVGVSFGIGGEVRAKFAGASPTILGEWSIRFYQPAGYLTSGPRDDGDLRELMEAAKAAGATAVVLDVGTGDLAWNPPGLGIVTLQAGLPQVPGPDLSRLPRGTVFLTRRVPVPGLPKPCGRFDEELGLYLVRDRNLLAKPFEQYDFWCPPGADVRRSVVKRDG